MGIARVEIHSNTFTDRIRHVHWKDLDEDWVDKRGEIYGCGMSPIALGEGVIDVAGVAETLRDAPDLEYTTLEVAGDENLRTSYEFLQDHGAE